MLALAHRYPLLDADTEAELLRRARAGEREAADRLVLCHLRDVVRLAHRLRGYGIPVEDLMAEGVVGLLVAIERFEPERNVRFMTYAAHWIKASVFTYIQKQAGAVANPTSAAQSRLFFNLRAARARLEQELEGELGGEALESRLAAELGTSAESVRQAAGRLLSRHASLDQPMIAGGPTAGQRLVADEPDPEAQAAERERDAEVRRRLAALWPRLDERERLIIREALMDDDLPLAELGRRLKISRERVRQLREGVKAKLRRELAPVVEPHWERRAAG